MPIKLPCPAAMDVERFLLGSLPEQEATSVGQHMEACPTCIEAARDTHAEDNLLLALRRGADNVLETDPPIVQSLIDSIAELGPSAPRATDFETDWHRLLAPAEESDEVGRLAGYRLLRLLGTGGMGAVFEAEDPSLRRHVALKVLKPMLAAQPAARARFLREARTAAKLSHDHIMAVHQIGEDRGLPFLTMPLLQGESLAQRLAREGQLSIAEAARVAQETAEGMAVAHRLGLIHRDIKPANIWLEFDPERAASRVKILDFGLARALDTKDSLTTTGCIVGTPGYMAPEQADGKPVDERGDLFSLGCMLYEMLVGQPPFEADGLMATLQAAALQEPKSLLELRPEIPPRLARLVQRLLSKTPQERPASAQEVIQELRSFDRPLARQRSWPTQRIVVAGLLLGLGLAGVGLHQLANRPTQEAGEPVPAIQVGPEQHAVAVFRGHTKEVWSVAFVNDGLKFISGSQDRTLREWDAAKPEQPGEILIEQDANIKSVAASRDGKLIAYAGSDGVIHIMDRHSRKERHSLDEHEGEVRGLVFSADSKRLVSGGVDNRVILWDIPAGKLIREYAGHTAPVQSVALSSDGSRVMAGAWDATARIWDRYTGKPLKTLEHTDIVWGIAFSPDGSKAVTGSGGRYKGDLNPLRGLDNTVRVWDLTATSPRARLLEGHTQRAVAAVAFVSSGRVLSCGLDGTIRLWDANTGEQLAQFSDHANGVRSVAISPDGQQFLTGSYDQTVRLWKLPPAK